MRQTRIPTIIGIIILVLSVGVGVFLVQFRQVFRSGATGDTSPKNVRVANISDTSATVSWTTDKETSGFVSWGENMGSLSQVTQDDTQNTGFTHLANLISLKPQTSYFFKINSGGSLYDNNGTPWGVKTGQTLQQPTSPNLISGSILTQNGSGAKKAIVYISLGGYLLSTLTSENGSWVIQMDQARTVDLSNYLQIDPSKTLLEISADAGPDGVASAQIYPQSAKPAPPIILGQISDFKNLSSGTQGVIPQASVDVGTQATATPSSGFNVPQGSSAPTTKTVTLQSLNEGEIITSTKPQFFGNGPSGTKLDIKVESEAVTGSVFVPSSGSWNWNIPAGLSPGTHKITITWKDAGGITRSLVRNFIVQAAEGPAFVSSPSASPSLKPTTTPSSFPTLIPTVSASETPTGTPKNTASASTMPQPPVSGSLTPTLLLFIMGLGIIPLSVLVWKKAEN